MRGIAGWGLAALVWTLPVAAQSRHIDTQRSFAHYRWRVTSSGNPSVQVWFESAKIKVLDPELGEDNARKSKRRWRARMSSMSRATPRFDSGRPPLITAALSRCARQISASHRSAWRAVLLK